MHTEHFYLVHEYVASQPLNYKEFETTKEKKITNKQRLEQKGNSATRKSNAVFAF